MAVIGPITDSQGPIVRANTDAAGNAPGRENSSSPSISADGRYVAFDSAATNFVSGDSNRTTDVFVKDLATGEVVRVSTDADGNQGDGCSIYPFFSADGRYVAFASDASNLVSGDTNGVLDIFVKDLQTGAIVLASSDADGNEAGTNITGSPISADGRWVLFESYSSDLVPGDTNNAADVFVKNLETGAVVRANTDANGEQLGPNSLGSYEADLSADGRYVAFATTANNAVPGDSNDATDVFVKDLRTGAVVRASTDENGNEANDSSYGVHLSANGRYAAFTSSASNLVSFDTNGSVDVFVKDLLTGQIVRASTDAYGHQANGNSVVGAISDDGRYVAFQSLASNLVPGDVRGTWDIFVKDLQTGGIVRVTTDANGHATSEFSYSYLMELSADGSKLVFATEASDLVPGDTNGQRDIFVKTVGSFLHGTIDDDQITGSFAADTIFGLAGDDVVTGHLGADSLKGDAGNDTLEGLGGNDVLGGGDGGDSLSGGANFDTLYGSLGNDTLDGGSQADRLFGGAGDDVLTGGQGLDWFVYARPASGNLGHDLITDFKDDYDKLRLAGYTAADVSIDNTNHVITLADGTTITLQNFTGTIDLGDFLFA